MSERIVIVEKDGPDMKLGVRLSGTKGNKVKIVEINRRVRSREGGKE